VGEFDLIARYLKPLAGEGAMGLNDDAARAFGQVMTKDVLVENVHFLPTDPLGLVARKALRVNMSDLIAKGAKPSAYLLGLVWPKRLSERDFALFSSGLDAEHRDHGLQLLGGDTTSGETLVISVTMFGLDERQSPLLRSGGQPGDLLVVTGGIGAGGLGLAAAKRAPSHTDQEALPYRLPNPPFKERSFISEHAKASLDVSDGLLADAQHLANASNVDLTIQLADVPMAPGAGSSLDERLHLLGAGDDYQTLFLMDSGARETLRSAVAEGLALRVIGVASASSADGAKVQLLDEHGSQLTPDRTGWDHFA